ncbi:MAG: dihydroneopterin aldolase [Firmicutes bacterium]|uniref:7,8-dihydroneopterin aldolase n=1 Tax=Candidatus Gallilactobacillus intestinavium TaxID=2840838 RepID=A0A9D9H9G6_9LACO|nr:dihydroneopterin aldolase [Candidatus Gallilactobacillus intestinavium]
MGKININNMTFYTYNGVFDEEKKLGQKIEVDVSIDFPIEDVVKNDDLNTTISYVNVFNVVKEFVKNNSFNLIESLANNLLSNLLNEFKKARLITLKVRKYSVPINGIFDDVEIEVSGKNLCQ